MSLRKNIGATTLFLFISMFVFGQNQNISNGFVFDGEPYLTINPNNSQHVVVAWMGWVNFTEQFKIKTKTSFDGGQTWRSTIELPHAVSGFTAADPVIEFNANGDVFVCYIDFTGTAPPVTGGVYISKSTDGGITWSTPVEVINTNYDGTKWPIDRPWMAIDKSNGSRQGHIYITTMNLNRNNPSYRPYLSVSKNNGNTFSTHYIDTVGWLAGSINPLPMASPAVSADGTFYASYPSYEITQSLYPQLFLAQSQNTGVSFTHQLISTTTTFSSTSNNEDAKKGGLLISNPANSNHLASISLANTFGDLDVFITETFDAGATWTSPVRVNDDSVSNNRMQDLLWADFDQDGDLVVSWRDRRNSSDSTYQTSSEIWAAFRHNDSTQFAPNFQITSQRVAYDTILASSGNDFMCVNIQHDTIKAAWGDTRNGRLNIWFQAMDISGKILSVHQLASEKMPPVSVYPNPVVSNLFIEGLEIISISISDVNGKTLELKNIEPGKQRHEIDLSHYVSGIYFVKLKMTSGSLTKKIIKK